MVGVAKTRRKARRFNLRMVRINSSFNVGALDVGVVTSGAMTSAAADKLRFISLIGAWSWSDLSAAIDDAMSFGVAHSDYTSAEIEEALEAVGAIDLGDKVAQEQSNRLVREIGIFSGSQTATTVSNAEFNDGKPVRTKLNWLMSAGDTLHVWVRNASGTIYTTGSAIKFSGKLWVKD